LPPTKPKNADVRSREYLTPTEAKALRQAAKHLGRHGFRDWVLLMMMYRHGLRVGETTEMKWDQVDMRTGKLLVNRLKNGDPSVHYIEADEMRALRKLQRDYPDSPFLFASERGGPLSSRTVHTIVARAGVEAGIKFPVHPHMLRHAKGYQLASKGVDTRAIHRLISDTKISSTRLSTPKRIRRGSKVLQRTSRKSSLHAVAADYGRSQRPRAGIIMGDVRD
jgi:type 1 fimbriae regulatory protein FimB/type 1 fimbriae regulatory protein FimE